jgi:diaminopimelate decarboxylase
MNRALWKLGINARQHLTLGDCDLVDLAERYGTPLHVVDEARLRGNYVDFVSAFRRHYPAVDVFYSYKTNCVPGLIELLHDEGCGAEVVSPYELWLALRLGVRPDRIIYNGIYKPAESLKMAIAAGVRLVNIDSIAEADRVMQITAELDRQVNLGIRIYPPIGWRGQFGVEADLERCEAVCKRLAAHPLCNVSCVAVHVGSGIWQAKNFCQIARHLCRTARGIQKLTGEAIRYLDLGGGFGVPTVKTLSVADQAWYKLLHRPPRPPNPKRCASVEEFAKVIGATIRDESRRAGLEEPSLLLEPGRAISSGPQVLLVKVHQIKQRRGGRTYAITDGGMQNIAFPLSYEFHHCLVANRAADEAWRRYFVTGPLCSPQDMLYRNWQLPKLTSGDVLAIMDAGAYFTSFANNFSFPRPPVAVVSQGQARLVRQRETFEHLMHSDECDMHHDSIATDFCPSPAVIEKTQP